MTFLGEIFWMFLLVLCNIIDIAQKCYEISIFLKNISYIMGLYNIYIIMYSPSIHQIHHTSHFFSYRQYVWC